MSDERWADARRLEAWAGEVRVNLLRAAALIVFYGHHLLDVYVYGRDAAPAVAVYHAEVTAIVLAWTGVVFVLYLCLSRRWVPPGLKYAASFWDVTMVSALLIASPDGPRSPLLYLYFVVVAASSLRLSLPLVYATTLGVMAAATLVMGHYVFYRVGREAYYAADSPYRIARSSEIIFLLSVGAVGLFAGQIVRQARRLVRGYPVLVQEAREGS
ncbi:MAG TPA: hypothetical protein VH643_20295 [Gemmataceae bacterium]|jgi:hypothetical protein